MRTTVIIPTYNEKENIARAIDGVLSVGIENVRILVVDDDSPDGTGEFAEAVAAGSSGRVMVLHRNGKRGLGSAYLEGFRLALSQGAEAVCEMDADGSHDPAALAGLIRQVASGADVAIGSRRVPGGRVHGWGIHRHAMSLLAMSFSRMVLGFKTRDITSGFRCYSERAAEKLSSADIASQGYAFQEETLYHCERLGLRIAEVPIIFRDRTLGKSKLSWREVPAFLRAILRLRRDYGRIGSRDFR